MFNKITGNIDFIFAIILFCIGLYGLTVKKNLIKKLIGLNIMETSVYLFFIALGDVRLGANIQYWGRTPIVLDTVKARAGIEFMVNPVPTGLILTAIVVSVSITALGLALSVKLYEHYGTLDTSKMKK
ncbi:MAG: cation:proton antiporter subunit C [bacterium]|nr:cation:proton antiporter subunit C [bacterium]